MRTRVATSLCKREMQSPYTTAMRATIIRLENTPCSKPSQIALATCCGCGAGFVLGATGVGAGIVLITSLTQMPHLAVPQLLATGTASGALASCYSTGAATWLQAGHGNLAVAGMLAASGIPGVLLGGKFAGRVPDAWLKLVFAGTMCGIVVPTSLYSAWAAYEKESPASQRVDLSEQQDEAIIGNECEDAGAHVDSLTCQSLWDKLAQEAEALSHTPLVVGRHCCVGLVVGFLTGAVAIGDTPLMIAYLGLCGHAQRDNVATALLAASPLAAIACISHLLRGNCIPIVFPILIFATGLGSYWGAQCSINTFSDWQLRGMYTVAVGMLGLRIGHGALASICLPAAGDKLFGIRAVLAASTLLAGGLCIDRHALVAPPVLCDCMQSLTRIRAKAVWMFSESS